MLLLLTRAQAALESKKRLAAKKCALAQSRAEQHIATATRIAEEHARRSRNSQAPLQNQHPSCARSLNLSSDEERHVSTVAGARSLQPPEVVELGSRHTTAQIINSGPRHAAVYSLSPDTRRQREQNDVRMALRHAIRARRSINGITVHDTRSIFASLDKDSSGELDMSELTLGLRRLGLGLTASQVNSLAEVLDVDHDGVVSIDEFSSWLHNCSDDDNGGSGAQAHAETPVRNQPQNAKEIGGTPSHLRSPTPLSVSKGMMHLKSDEHIAAARLAAAQLTHVANEETTAAAEAAKNAKREAEIVKLESEERRRNIRYEQQRLEEEHREHLAEMKELAAAMRERESIERHEEDAQRIATHRQAQEAERRWIANVNSVSCLVRNLPSVVSVLTIHCQTLSDHTS